MNILIKNGRIIDPANQVDMITSIGIKNNKIHAMSELADHQSYDKIIDAQDCWVIPALVDLCNRPYLKHPHGTTLKHEANIAAEKGIAALCIPPDTNPIIDNTSELQRIKNDASRVTSKLYTIAALTQSLAGKSITDFSALKEAGCIALSQAQSTPLTSHFLRTCYDYAASFDIPVVIQPQDWSLSQDGCAHEGAVATRLGLPAIPYTAETIAIAQHLALIEQTGIQAHFTCLSAHQSLELILQAKQKGLPVTADVAMHSLILSEMDVMHFDGHCHLYPPLRSQSDQIGLIQGVQNQTIDAICSDHRPLDAMAKLAPFAETLPGLSSIDTYLSLGISLVEKQKLDAATLVRALTANPASIFNLPAGCLTVGDEANICIVNPKAYWQVTSDSMQSAGKNSPFRGWELPGKIIHTIIQGDLIH
tara:strand:+ start:10893 stop:12155 length:1263 start_codon:yes stop_codon:yes gene_type:complete